MKTSSYRARDYSFGQAMLSLRTTIGLTQVGLARHLGVSRKAVGEWEAGLTYPKTEHIKALIAFAAQQQAFPSGREIAVINSVLFGGFVGLLLTVFSLPLWVCTSAGVVAFLVSVVIYQRYQWSQWMRLERNLLTLFPGQPGE